MVTLCVLQVVTFLHTVLLSSNLKFRTALVVCPLNTLLNWVSEFKKWQSSMGQDTVKVSKQFIVLNHKGRGATVCSSSSSAFHIEIQIMSQVTEVARLKDHQERLRALQSWQRDGGVVIIGYEMYRNLTLSQKITNEEFKAEIKRVLVDPGMATLSCPDVV